MKLYDDIWFEICYAPLLSPKMKILLPAVRSYLKKVFWPNFFVGASFKIFEILKYACGFKLGPAANLNQNPFFEMASSLTTIPLPPTTVPPGIKSMPRRAASGIKF